MPLRGHGFAIEGSKGFEKVVVNDIAFELLLDPIPRAKGVGVPKVEVDLDEGGAHLESNSAARYHLLHSSVDAEGKLVRPKELSCRRHPIHPYEDPAAKANKYRFYSNRPKARVFWINAVFEHELVERVHPSRG
jgi:hypothetical protein